MMKSIMFNDRFLLTQAVIEGRKRQIRRMEALNMKISIDVKEIFREFHNNKIQFRLRDAELNTIVVAPQYQIGEIVAVAQWYSDINLANFDECERNTDCYKKWYNKKMFVKPELMPNRIEITNVRLQRLKDITDEECLLEGIEKEERTDGEYNYIFFDARRERYIRERTPRDAYARLIDAISWKGTWYINPYVFVYDFELVK